MKRAKFAEYFFDMLPCFDSVAKVKILLKWNSNNTERNDTTE